MSQSYEPKQQPETALPKPCLGGCGFFGRSEQMGYCSICYTKCVPLEQRAQLQQSEKTAETQTKQENENKPENDSIKEQTKKNRCWTCQKKIPLAGRFDCKCGYVYCSAHRFPDTHECNFDYKAAHQKKLDAMNPVVAPSKVEKI